MQAVNLFMVYLQAIYYKKFHSMQVLCQSKENHRSRSVQCLTIRQFDFQIDIFVLTFVHYLRLKGQVRDANMPIA